MKILNDINMFVQVAKAGSFSKAAKLLDVPPATLSRRISSLEQELKIRLFHRTTRIVTLTTEGKIYFEKAAKILEQASIAYDELKSLNTQVTGPIKFSAPPDFAVMYIAPIIAEFNVLYPEVLFDIHLSSDRVDLVSGGYDFAVRIGRLPDSSLISKPVGSVQSQLYASSRYIELHGTPVNVADLKNHKLLSFSGVKQFNLWNSLTKEVENFEFTPSLTSNNMTMLQAMVEKNAGIALLPRMCANQGLQNLVAILPYLQTAQAEVNIVVESRLLPLRVTVFIEFLQKRLSELLR